VVGRGHVVWYMVWKIVMAIVRAHILLDWEIKQWHWLYKTWEDVYV
jgi:hypothetical protein